MSDLMKVRKESRNIVSTVVAMLIEEHGLLINESESVRLAETVDAMLVAYGQRCRGLTPDEWNKEQMPR